LLASSEVDRVDVAGVNPPSVRDRGLEENNVNISQIKGRQIKRLEADVEFLLPRAGAANRCVISEERGCRDTGISSNALVRAAYGGEIPREDEYPSDPSDMCACLRAWRKLPPHRQSKRAHDILESYKCLIGQKWGKDKLAECIRHAEITPGSSRG